MPVSLKRIIVYIRPWLIAGLYSKTPLAKSENQLIIKCFNILLVFAFITVFFRCSFLRLNRV